jgi:hypothetical protein
MAVNQRSCPGVWSDALRDPRDMVKLRREAPCCMSRFSREELGGRFLDLMAYLDRKREGDRSMSGKRRSCPVVRNDAPRDPHDMVKA